jgi:hypothetical protein
MRAEKYRGSRIRSRSSRNKLIERNIRQSSPASPGFFFFRRRAAQQASAGEILNSSPHFYGNFSRLMYDAGFTMAATTATILMPVVDRAGF